MAGMGMGQYMQLGNASFQGTQAGLELYNAYRLNQKLKGMDDTYRIPPEIQANLNDANSRALEGLPTAYANQYRQQLANNSAYANTNLGSLSAGVRGIAGTQNAQNAGDQNLLAMNSQAQAQNQNTLYGMRNQMADFKDMAWKHNVDTPYWITSNKKDAYFTAAGRDASKASNSAAAAFGGGGTAPNEGADLSKSKGGGNGYIPQNYAMSPYQTQGQPISTSNPYANQQELTGTYSGNGGSTFHY